MRQDNEKRNKRQNKPLIIICVIIAVCVITGLFMWLTNVRQLRIEREKHIATAVEHIKYGAYNISESSEIIILFYTLCKQAETFAEISDYNAAISMYEEARSVAQTLPFPAGVKRAGAGIDEMHERILIAKRIEAMNLFVEGERFYNENQYADALEFFYSALELYVELEDQQNITLTKARIDYSERKLAEPENQDSDEPKDTQEENDEQMEISMNYEHNISINFDLRTLIDNQNQKPATLIKMGSSHGRNEGWYNGCGWVATYNALIILGNPEHPAEIVRYFEESGGAVLGGVFGTYPNAIADYLRRLGYNINHKLFPQRSANIDELIKNSRVAILAYAHTSAAHYTTIEYRDDIEKFIIYNDNYARARSASLGFQNDAPVGAVIDSVAEFIINTPNILFSFSLITVL